MLEIAKLIEEKQFLKAEDMLNSYIEMNEADGEAYRKRADVYLKNGKYIQALHDIEKAMLLDPKMECCKSSYEHYQIKKGLMRMSNDI